MIRKLSAPALAILLAGCVNGQPSVTAPISANPVADTAVASAPAPLSPNGSTIGQDLSAAYSNLDQAMTVGALAATDPAAACVGSVMAQAGIAVPGAPATTAPSFVPVNDGPASLGAIVYIRAKQAAAAAGGLTASPPCLQIVGQFVVDGLKAAANVQSQVGTITAIGALIPK
jgi:hypothetical protein